MAGLNEKIALITGGNSGIGFAAAKLFASEGAKVVIVGRRASNVQAAAEEIGPAAIGIQGDISSQADLDRIYASIDSRFGRLDIVFANAGLLTLTPFDKVAESQFTNEFDVNVKGTFFTVQKALPYLAPGSSIIMTSSIAHFMGVEGYAVYAAAKAAVRSFARSFAVELKHRQIRVNCLSPGPTATPLGGKMGIPSDKAEAYGKFILEQIPLGRFGNPDETARAALFLASDDSSFITGIDLCVDGGMGQI